ncbi:MAG: HD domain-containing protein [Candidatus Promineifilaceae bacterium]
MTARPLSSSMLAEVAQVLDEPQLSLFRRMSPADQRHAYRVHRLLREAGQSDNALLSAALLHDVGKVTADLSVWDRTLAVLGETFAPRRVASWGDNDVHGWKRTFVVRKHHAVWGAQLAAESGASSEVVELIRRHQDPPPANSRGEDRLILLQWADGKS